jgi:hypothetical protein
MKWATVRELAAEHGLELYSPLGGYHRNLQIIDRVHQQHWWTRNKAGLAHQSILAIVQQKELAKLTDDEAIAQSQKSKSYF